MNFPIFLDHNKSDEQPGRLNRTRPNGSQLSQEKVPGVPQDVGGPKELHGDHE